MGFLKGRRPSPAMVVAGMALIIALAGTAMAAPTAIKSVLSKKEKSQVKNIVNGLAPGLSVANAANASNAANAANANNANTLDGVDSTGFLQVKSRVREVNDTTEDTNYTNDINLIQLSNLAAGQWVIQATTQIDNDTGSALTINCDLINTNGTVQLDSQSEVHDAQGQADILSHILLGSLTASAAGTDDVFVRCTSDGATDADQEKIVATFLGA
jgi:hypothetical protein